MKKVVFFIVGIVTVIIIGFILVNLIDSERLHSDEQNLTQNNCTDLYDFECLEEKLPTINSLELCQQHISLIDASKFLQDIKSSNDINTTKNIYFSALNSINNEQLLFSNLLLLTEDTNTTKCINEATENLNKNKNLIHKEYKRKILSFFKFEEITEQFEVKYDKLWDKLQKDNEIKANEIADKYQEKSDSIVGRAQNMFYTDTEDYDIEIWKELNVDKNEAIKQFNTVLQSEYDKIYLEELARIYESLLKFGEENNISFIRNKINFVQNITKNSSNISEPTKDTNGNGINLLITGVEWIPIVGDVIGTGKMAYEQYSGEEFKNTDNKDKALKYLEKVFHDVSNQAEEIHKNRKKSYQELIENLVEIDEEIK